MSRFRRTAATAAADMGRMLTDGEGRPLVQQEWVEAERLRPVKANPNGHRLGGY